MYYFAKIAQATGLGVIAVAFLQKFPEVLNYKTLGIGVGVFAFGWVIEGFLLKK